MTSYSVTGPSSDLSIKQLIFIRKVIHSVAEDADELTTGGAPGVDTAAFVCGVRCHIPVVRLIVPAAPWNEIVHRPYLQQENVCVEYAPKGKDRSDSYMKRNDLLVVHGNVLLAFPKTPKPVTRSGTWATIRRARKAGKTVRLFPLNLQQEV